MSENKFSVLDMAKEMADANDVDINDLFKKPQPKPQQTDEHPIETPPTETKKKEYVPWTPDESLLDGMDELKAAPVTYTKEELKKSEEDGGLHNIADDNALRDSIEAMDELSRTHANIEEAKRRRGIKKLSIPPGQYHATITAAAGDTNFKRAQEALDEIFSEIENTYPEFILEWEDPNKNNPMSKGVEAPNFHENSGKIQDIPEEAAEAADKTEDNIIDFDDKTGSQQHPVEPQDAEEVKIVIDKSQLPQITWDAEEIDKIKKSRTVELNIVEKMDLEYSQIEDADDNAVDAILSEYQRKTNDIVAPLPASKYRATFVGLSYTEVIDLSNSQELNNLDGEYKKWSICFNHIKNQSIGPWEEYQWYKDPDTHKRIKLPITASIPPGINPTNVHVVTKFEDFLMKTSFMDLEYMLWKILCATSMEQEIISIDCHAVKSNGKECGKSYDWIYSPSDLLVADSIDPAVLEDMEKTATASTKEDVERVYNSSMLRLNNTTRLNTSGFNVVFGHISAYEYLTSIYGEIKSLEDAAENDPTLASRGLTYTTLTVVKGFVIDKPDGRKVKISGTKNLIKTIDTLDEIDWQTLSELVRIMVEPYQFRFALRDIVCPQCKNRSNIPIESMTRLLFIVARSLSSVSVTLKKA